jgi:hypothetical protein
MRLLASIAAVSLTAMFLQGNAPQTKGFLGRWNLTGTGENANHVYWLEVSESGNQLTGKFLNRGGSPVDLAKVAVANGELVFQLPPGNNNAPGTEFHAKLQGDKLVGSHMDDKRTVNWVGVRPPKWPPSDANAPHKFGTPVELFNGKSWDAFGTQPSNYEVKWTVEDGALTNTPPTRNLVSKQKFKDFKINAEYKLAQGSNSGIYLRGRYELQVLDDYGKPPDVHSHMAIYAWVAPRVNASKPVGEWQAMEAVIVGNRVTVSLNGQRVQDNSEIQAITGGALDANETEPGPIMLQGDHTKVWYRKVIVTPIQ